MRAARTAPLLAVAVALFAPMSTFAQSPSGGAGAPPYFSQRTAHFTVFAPLSRNGAEALRIDYLAFQHIGWVITLYPGGRRGAAADIVWRGDRGEVVGWYHRSFPRKVYDTLMGRADAAIVAFETPHGSGISDIYACPDGDDVVIERRKQGRTRWIRPECGYQQAAFDAAEAAVDAFPELLCWSARFAHDLPACQTMEPTYDRTPPADGGGGSPSH